LQLLKSQYKVKGNTVSGENAVYKVYRENSVTL
jgi:hypothetical protein